jgi:hypothetical protein
LPAPPTAMGPSRDEGYSIPRGKIRPGRRLPPPYGGFGCRGIGYRVRFPGVSARLDGIVWPPAHAVSSVAFVGPRSGDGAIVGQRVPLRQRMRAVLQLLFGPAKTAGG